MNYKQIATKFITLQPYSDRKVCIDWDNSRDNRFFYKVNGREIASIYVFEDRRDMYISLYDYWEENIRRWNAIPGISVKDIYGEILVNGIEAYEDTWVRVVDGGPLIPQELTSGQLRQFLKGKHVSLGNYQEFFVTNVTRNGKIKLVCRSTGNRISRGLMDITKLLKI